MPNPYLVHLKIPYMAGFAGCDDVDERNTRSDMGRQAPQQ